MEAKKLLDIQNALYYLYHLDEGNLSNFLLEENNIIRKEGEEFELWGLNQDTVDAIEEPCGEYEEYRY